MEDLEKRSIEDLTVVRSVCLHAGDKTHKGDVYVNLRCCAASSYGVCGVKLVGPIRQSIETCTAAAQELQAAEKDAADTSTKRATDADPPIVSPCKGIMACFSFMFLGVPRILGRSQFSTCASTS